MKTVKVADLEAVKIQNRQGLFQKDIFDRKDGAERFSFHLSSWKRAAMAPSTLIHTQSMCSSSSKARSK